MQLPLLGTAIPSWANEWERGIGHVPMRITLAKLSWLTYLHTATCLTHRCLQGNRPIRTKCTVLHYNPLLHYYCKHRHFPDFGVLLWIFLVRNSPITTNGSTRDLNPGPHNTRLNMLTARPMRQSLLIHILGNKLSLALATITSRPQNNVLL